MTCSQSSYNDIFASGLMPYDEALSRVLSGLPGVDGCERLLIEKARGRTLHKSVTSTLNVPSFTNSAVDGYALHSRDIPEQGFKKLAVKNVAFAGQPFDGVVEAGECLRIMTGAPIPEQLDTVIMQEHVEPENGYINIDNRCRAGKNVRKAGEDIRIGDTVLAAGRLLVPPDIGLLAALGISEVEVNRKLTIAVASTGNEVYVPGQSLGAGGLYDSNRYSLMAALARPDVEVVDLGILPDDVDVLLKSFNDAGCHADVIISSGGVSVGEADYTKMALQNSGKVDFWRVAIKPGRPFAFGRIGNAAFFGLPGNPVAVLVTFYFFVLPALEKMLQVTDKPIMPTFKACATEDLRKLPGRTEVQRAIISRNEKGEWQVKTTGKQGSGILSSMSRANAFIILDHDSGSVSTGEQVTVMPFSAIF
ncbi:MAG: molybdopterin molybdenumtransferase MoeA [Candidatus Riflebacteria bacterium HGW-Riflebacteria-1]|jgi:molybdopterin molybdotransferase|nr:MAG: molybdopterin molybdenumtransferase MoeA [Candidatus Riflebacteria bacterium HGW-Riflebacteria-1]